MIQILYYILFIICFFYGVYFFVFGLFGFLKSKKLEDKKWKTKFAILLPSRNEENVIGDIIDSLYMQKYDQKLYDVYVIINNTTDNTKGVALKHGAKVMEVDVPVKSKGEVLIWTKEKLKNSDYDAYIIFDSDNLVHEDFLAKMNNVFQAGYVVAQGFRDSKNLGDNWITTSYSIFYYFQNYFFNKARKNLNLSASINGTGFMVEKKFFEDTFKTQSLTEDVEFTALCTLKQTNVYFAEDAITYDEHTTNFKDSWKQRRRWSKGMLQCLKIYKKDLLKNTFKNGNQASFDLYMNFISPIMQILTFLLGIILYLFKIFNVTLTDFYSYIISNTFLFFVITYLVGVCANIFIILVNKRSVKESLPGIILFSVFILSWIPININALFDKKNTWEQIKHYSKKQ